VIGLVARHHLFSRYAVENRVHDGPLRRGDLPTALSFLAGKLDHARAAEIGLELLVFDEDAAPDDLAGLADALERASAEVKIHRRLAFTDRTGIAADVVGRRNGA
jgi:hypothetical protein